MVYKCYDHDEQCQRPGAGPGTWCLQAGRHKFLTIPPECQTTDWLGQCWWAGMYGRGSGGGRNEPDSNLKIEKLDV